MIPGMNPRKMNHMMKRMGISQQEVDATEVIIRTKEHDIIIHDPQVSKVNMMGQKTYQIVGQEEIREHGSPDISEEDIETVMEQAGVDEETARAAIVENDGDLAKAILDLKE